MLTGNKGEWSEIYALMKLLSDRQLIAGDGDLNQIAELIYPIIEIIREEAGEVCNYKYDSDLVIITGENKYHRVPISEFKVYARKLYLEIKKTQSRSFSIPFLEDFLKKFECKTIKAKSSNKSDIKIVIHDRNIGSLVKAGFSIKSQLGSPSTLLNPGKTTNFIFQLVNKIPKETEIKTINLLDEFKIKLAYLNELGIGLEFQKIENDVFQNNLILIDSYLPKIISELLLYYYSGLGNKLIDLVPILFEKNPLKYSINLKHPFYTYKIKKMLVESALGMTPAKVWDGTMEATGGYLVVKETGEVLCYHIYNRNLFEDYLLKNTKLDTASKSRYDFGNIYEKSGEYFIKLNLQIRFIK